MHVIDYNDESDGIDYQTSKQIADDVEAWDDGSSHQFGGFAFDRVNQGMRISLQVTDVSPSEISEVLSDLDEFIDSINSDHGVLFPSASDTARIRPDQS
jgi:hypothetical protein